MVKPSTFSAEFSDLSRSAALKTCYMFDNRWVSLAELIASPAGFCGRRSLPYKASPSGIVGFRKDSAWQGPATMLHVVSGSQG